MHWFKHSSNERSSATSAFMMSKYGNYKGFAMWMRILEGFCGNDGLVDNVRMFSYSIGEALDEVQETLDDLVELGTLYIEDEAYILPMIRDEFDKMDDEAARHREAQRRYRERLRAGKLKDKSPASKTVAPEEPAVETSVVETTDDPIEDEIPLPDSVEEEVAVEIDPDDTQTKIETLEVATEIYDYYRDNIRGGKRRDTIDRIQRLLLGTHFADERRVYTADELYGIIDNYLKLYDGSRDSMYTPERMFGRDAFFKMYLPGAIGAEEGLAALEVEHKAKEQAVELYNYYTSYIRKNGTTTYAKTQAIARIQDIILGRAPKLDRAYSADEIRKATDNYRFEKSNTEEKYRATANNFFGGEKFYIKDFLNKEQPSVGVGAKKNEIKPSPRALERIEELRRTMVTKTEYTEPVDLSAALREVEGEEEAKANQQ